MNCSIKELKEGQEYVFLRSIVKQKENIPIYHGTLVELESGNCVTALFHIHEFNDHEVFCYRTIVNRYIGDCSDEILDKPEMFHMNADKDEELEKAMCGLGIGFIISDSEENAIIEYKNFMDRSLLEYQKKIDKADEYDKPSMKADLEAKKQIYKEQINWLKNHYEI